MRLLLVLGFLAALTTPASATELCPPSGLHTGSCVDAANPGYEKQFIDGRFAGWTHISGDGIIPEGDPGAGVADASSFECVDPLREPFHIQAVWARAADASQAFSDGGKAVIRQNLMEAMSVWDATARNRGANAARLKIACDGPTINISTVNLATASNRHTTQTVFADLDRAGYSQNTVKYWVLYEHEMPSCGCSGIALTALDDTPGPLNLNNGYIPQTAINFNRATNEFLWLHELSHTMGAVQTSAPNSSGAGHCIDGLDVMCYNDRGPQGYRYNTNRCPFATPVFDCGADDYFHPKPQIGSYLSTHWNLASNWNRFHVLDPPLILPI